MSNAANTSAASFVLTSVEGSLSEQFENVAMTADEVYMALQMIEDDAPEGCTNAVTVVQGDDEARLECGSSDCASDIDAFNDEWLAA